MRGRASLSALLLIGGFVLLVSVALGMGMGNRVLGQIGAHVPVQPTPVPQLTGATDENGAPDEWRHTSVLSVATDPGFPDPRVTPEPAAPETARPRPVATRPPPVRENTPRPHYDYTSPPLPLPLVSHTPEGQETVGPDIEATAAPDYTPPPQQGHGAQARFQQRFATAAPQTPPGTQP